MIRSFVSSTSPTKVKYITTALLLIVTTVPYDVICLDRGWHHAYLAFVSVLLPSPSFALSLARSASNNGPLQQWNDQTDHGLRPCHDSEATTTNDDGALGIHKITSGTIWHLFSLLDLVFPAVFLSPDWSKRAETGRLTTRREDIWMMITSIVVDRRRQRAHGQRRWMVMNHTWICLDNTLTIPNVHY